MDFSIICRWPHILIISGIVLAVIGVILLSTGCARVPRQSELVPFGDYLKDLKAQITRAQELAAENESAHFYPGPIKLSFDVVVSKEGEGGVQLSVVPIQLSGKYSKQDTQKVEISLDPIRFTSGDIEVLEGGKPMNIPMSGQETLDKWIAADIVKIAETHYVLGVYKLENSEEIYEVLLPVKNSQEISIRANLH